VSEISVDIERGGDDSPPAKPRKDPNTCPTCRSHYRDDELSALLRVCRQCGHHFVVSSPERIAQLCDPGSFVEHAADLRSADPLAFIDLRPYTDRLTDAELSTGVGDAMIIYLAGLLDVPATQIEAAKIDGANALRRYWHVTLPSISPVIFFTLVTGLIWTFQTFTEAYVAGNTTSGQKDTLGEPQGSLLFYAVWLYQQGFRYFNMGYASAMAWVLFGATMVCTLILIKTSERWVHVQGDIR